MRLHGGNMAAVDESHFPTEQKCTHDEKTGPGEVVRMCRSECNATQIDNATSGSSSDRPVDSQQDTRASSANTVSPAACVWKPPAGDATRTGPDQDNQTSPEAHIPCNVTHRTPMSGDERGDGEARDVHCDLNFTKLLVQPDNMSDVDMEKADKIKDSPDDKSHERDTLNGLEEDIGIEGTGNSVDSKTGDKVDAITKCKNVNLQCKDCGKRFNRRETLNLHRHFHAHNDPTPLTCKECDLTFQDRSSFIKHRKAHKEKKQEMIGSQRSRFTCAHCGKCFSKVEKLRGHNCNKFPDKPYHCPLCRREFQFKVAIPKHMQTHSLENIFQCQECNKHFSDGTAFHSHQRSHAALKPYECPECGMAFKHYSVMEDHRRRHTDGMPSHNCNICGKTFKYSSLLHQHQYLHTGQKPFCCPECGKTFAFAQNMKAHYRQHRLSTTTPLVPAYRPSKKEPVPSHEPAPGLGKENTGQSVKLRPVYNCPLCPLKFDIPAKLRTHMLIHEAESEKLENAPIKGTYELMNSEKGYNCPQDLIFHIVHVGLMKRELKNHAEAYRDLGDRTGTTVATK
ncbi:hypothetical protein NHX12_001581 [Muraenolepis orangiensis]|uniref:C2H2-type domain-containing protein n=1 Tax=Muraenolepis orangiensis TaxID=630683 RepID=A0A9Q0E4U2_9TELE|nr:hypothetical protein NHX12_001581 [Muraenolepis orangiensis]